MFIAGKGYDSNYIRETIEPDGGTPIIPARVNLKGPEPIDWVTYALRNYVEHTSQDEVLKAPRYPI